MTSRPLAQRLQVFHATHSDQPSSSPLRFPLKTSISDFFSFNLSLPHTTNIIAPNCNRIMTQEFKEKWTTALMVIFCRYAHICWRHTHFCRGHAHQSGWRWSGRRRIQRPLIWLFVDSVVRFKTHLGKMKPRLTNKTCSWRSHAALMLGFDGLSNMSKVMTSLLPESFDPSQDLRTFFTRINQSRGLSVFAYLVDFVVFDWNKVDTEVLLPATTPPPPPNTPGGRPASWFLWFRSFPPQSPETSAGVVRVGVPVRKWGTCICACVYLLAPRRASVERCAMVESVHTLCALFI